MPHAHWRRDEPQFYNFLALERSPLDAPGVADGLTGALMSRDTLSEAHTFVVELPPGWRVECDAAEAMVEWFIMRGDLSLEGERAGASGYLQLVQGGSGELGSEAGALALLLWNPDIPAFPEPYTRTRVLKAWQEQWTPSVPGAHGIMHKSLRLPDPVPHPSAEGFDGGPGGYLRFQFIPPSFIAAEEHVHHECFEEIILLQGDCMLVNEGVMGIGSVVCHPQEWYHAPFVTRSGALILVHTDAPMGFPWPPRPYPNTMRVVEAYLDDAPFDVPTEHVAWTDSPLAALQDTPEYLAWRATPDGALWGDTVGRGMASAYRRSWRREIERQLGT